MTSQAGVITGNIAKSLLISDGQTERFTFKRFDGALLRQSVAQGQPYPEDKIETVALRINPELVRHQQPRVTQKVQTNRPDRFVIFDWGVDLHVMEITGNTGNLLPEIVQGGLDPLKPVFDFYGSRIDAEKAKSPAQGIDSALSLASEALLGNSSYFELLGMSRKYRTFVKLQELYLKADADRDICTLEYGDFVYRIFFVDFTFTQEANSPWNWKYTISLNVLSDLTQFNRKGDEKPNEKNTDKTQ